MRHRRSWQQVGHLTAAEAQHAYVAFAAAFLVRRMLVLCAAGGLRVLVDDDVVDDGWMMDRWTDGTSVCNRENAVTMPRRQLMMMSHGHLRRSALRVLVR